MLQFGYQDEEDAGSNRESARGNESPEGAMIVPVDDGKNQGCDLDRSEDMPKGLAG